MAVGLMQKKRSLFGVPSNIPGMRDPGGPIDESGALSDYGAGQGMQQAQPEKKGVNWGGVIADFLAGVAGRPGVYGPMVAQQREQDRLFERQQQLMQQRSENDWARFQREHQYKIDNPVPSDPYRWRDNDGNLMQIGADGKPVMVYDDPKAKTEWVKTQNPDGTISIMPMPNSGGLPTFTDDDWNGGASMGGTAGNGGGNFQR